MKPSFVPICTRGHRGARRQRREAHRGSLAMELQHTTGAGSVMQRIGCTVAETKTENIQREMRKSGACSIMFMNERSPHLKWPGLMPAACRGKGGSSPH